MLTYTGRVDNKYPGFQTDSGDPLVVKDNGEFWKIYRDEARSVNQFDFWLEIHGSKDIPQNTNHEESVHVAVGVTIMMIMHQFPLNS